MFDASTSLTGIQKGMASLRQHAHTVATQPAGTRASTTAQIGMIASEHAVTASTKVLQAEDRMLGHLLDVRA